jgi:hypothetical protein
MQVRLPEEGVVVGILLGERWQSHQHSCCPD